MIHLTNNLTSHVEREIKFTSLRLSKRSAQVNFGATGTVTLNLFVRTDVPVVLYMIVKK